MKKIYQFAQKRFVKMFIFGGLGAIAMLLKAGVSVHSVADAKHLGLVLVGAFVTAGLAALEKAITSYIASQQS